VRMCVNNTGRRKYPWFCGNYLGMWHIRPFIALPLVKYHTCLHI
jgi:hypothetical protein